MQQLGDSRETVSRMITYPSQLEERLHALSPMQVREKLDRQIMQPSLQEVAKLLIVLHDQYLKEAVGTAILHELMRLLRDLNLVDVLCILDVERMRLKAMKRNGDCTIMSYESFYEWLREASILIFKKFNETGSRALSLLMTKYIIPFATKEIKGKFAIIANHSNVHVKLDESTLCAYMPYGEFLHLWFSSKTLDDNIRLCPLHCFSIRSSYHTQSANFSSTLSVEKIFGDMITCGVFQPEMIHNGASSLFFAEMVQAVSAPRDSNEMGDGLNCLAFPGFLKILESIAGHVRLSEVQSLGMGLTLATKLIVLLQKLTEKMLNGVLQRFVDYEVKVRRLHDDFGEETESSLSLSRNGRGNSPAPVSLTASSVLWLARQAGLTQLKGLSLNVLHEELIARSDASQVRSKSGGQREHAWSITHLPQMLCQIAEKYSDEISVDTVAGLTGIDSTGRVALLLAQHIPALFFASPVCIPPVLGLLYEHNSLNHLQSISHLLDDFFLAISNVSTMYSRYSQAPSPSSSTTSLREPQAEFATYKDFRKLCSYTEVTPRLLSKLLLQETCEHILGYYLSDAADSIQICRNDWIEILYTLAQICFSDSTDRTVTASHPIEEMDESERCIQKLHDFLNCFQSAKYFEESVFEQRQGSNLQSFLLDSVRLRSAVRMEQPASRQLTRSLFGAPSEISPVSVSDIVRAGAPPASKRVLSSTKRNGSAGVSTSVFRTNGEGNGETTCSGFSVRQIMISLAHYPHNSFNLNPWAMHKILMDTANLSSEVDDQVDRGADSDNTWQQIARVFQSFCSQYKIKSTDLTSYFSSFYKGDYYVADTVQMLKLRDEESKYGMPVSPFRYDGGKAYSKTVKVMKPAIQGVMASPVFDLLFTERANLLLSTHSDLLCWEFSAACALQRSSDPFTRDLKTPIPTTRSMTLTPRDCRMTIASALTWAVHAVGISRTEAILQLKRTVLLSGGGGIITGYLLTYSVFVIYAVHCFTAQALLNGPLQNLNLEDVFEECLQQMIMTSAAHLDNVQATLQMNMDVLAAMYKPATADLSVIRIGTAERLIIIRHALEKFDYDLNQETSCTEIVVAKLPPRPPVILWDASRFLEFCCYYGLVERVGSLLSPVKAFKSYLSGLGLISEGSSEGCVLALMPIRISCSLLMSLLDETAGDAKKWDLIEDILSNELSMGGLYHHEPSQQSANDGGNSPLLLSNTTIEHTRGYDFEDIVRYGGDKAMSSFSLCQSGLKEAYASLVLTSSLAIPVAVAVSVGATNGNHQAPTEDSNKIEKDVEEEGCSGGEAILSVVCTYLSCCCIIQSSKIAKIAKRSLHSRLRPMLVPSAGTNEGPSSESKQGQGVSSYGANIADVVTGKCMCVCVHNDCLCVCIHSQPQITFCLS